LDSQVFPNTPDGIAQLEAHEVTENITFSAVWRANFSFDIGNLDFGQLRATTHMLLGNVIVALGGEEFTEVVTRPDDIAIAFRGVSDTGWGMSVRAVQSGGTDFYSMIRVNGVSINGDNGAHIVYTHKSGMEDEVNVTWGELGFGIEIPNDTRIGGSHTAQLHWTHQPTVTP